MIELIFVLALLSMLFNGFVFYKARKLFKPIEATELVQSSWEPFDGLSEAIKGLAEDVKLGRVEQSRHTAVLAKALDGLPTKTLNTIQGSINTTTGKLGEMIKFIELQRMYDRLIPVGDVIDFLAIRFPRDDDPGEIVFIDVKTGDKAVLNSDQKKLRALISDHKEVISFKVVKVDIT